MVNAIVSIPGYVHLYRSLLRFYDMPENEVREMLYLLNTANLDCYESVSYTHLDVYKRQICSRSQRTREAAVACMSSVRYWLSVRG